MSTYKPTRNDIIYEDDKYVILKKDVDVVGSLFSTFDLLEIVCSGIPEAIEEVVSLIKKKNDQRKILRAALKPMGRTIPIVSKALKNL